MSEAVEEDSEDLRLKWGSLRSNPTVPSTSVHPTRGGDGEGHAEEGTRPTPLLGGLMCRPTGAGDPDEGWWTSDRDGP